MSGRCQICNSYICRCSELALRQYREDHVFDHSPNVLRRWEQDDAMTRVNDELRSRRKRADEEQDDREQQQKEARQREARQRAQEEEQQEEEPGWTDEDRCARTGGAMNDDDRDKRFTCPQHAFVFSDGWLTCQHCGFNTVLVELVTPLPPEHTAKVLEFPIRDQER